MKKSENLFSTNVNNNLNWVRKLCLKCKCIESLQITTILESLCVFFFFFHLVRQFIIFIVSKHRNNRNSFYERIFLAQTLKQCKQKEKKVNFSAQKCVSFAHIWTNVKHIFVWRAHFTTEIGHITSKWLRIWHESVECHCKWLTLMLAILKYKYVYSRTQAHTRRSRKPFGQDG